jgi:hypothetical protein
MTDPGTQPDSNAPRPGSLPPGGYPVPGDSAGRGWAPAPWTGPLPWETSAPDQPGADAGQQEPPWRSPAASHPPGLHGGAIGRPGRRAAGWTAVIAVALAAGVALAVAPRGGTPVAAPSAGKTPAAPAAGASRSSGAAPSPTAGTAVRVGDGESGPGTLAGVLEAADSSVEGRGLLPAAKCNGYQQDPGGAIVCTSPLPGVAQVSYQDYSSLSALYSAYKAQVAELDGGTFRQDTRTCGDGAVSYAEFGWNQEEGHPHGFTVAQMAAGKVGQLFAEGRMACFATRTPHGVSQDIVWTIDNGLAMGVAVGSGSPRAVYELWASLHHAVLFRGTEMCGTAPRMNLSDIPSGNLKILPVCPPGVEALPSSPPA